ncbi:MAG: tetratricopeptide repeat protein [Steroidobacteraceae bacterium]
MRAAGRIWVLALVGALAAAAPAAVLAKRRPDPGALAPIQVQDLAYGDVLFHYWADQDSGLEALTRLEAYMHWGLMPHHRADAQLLAAGLYLQLGMHNEAGERFAALLNGKVPVAVRDRAWFYLAKIWYDRGYYDRCEQALGRIKGKLAPEQAGERTNMLVNALMSQKRYDQAIALLQNWQGSADWQQYARFNLGVALVRVGRLPQADGILTAVGTLSSNSGELLDLRDKADLALGFAHLQANQPAVALQALQRVRLDGPYSSRALLADGWAQAALGQYRAALVPWLALHRRNLLDAAVQESYLAVPYAFTQLDAGAQAAQYYQSALQSFASESNNIGAAVAHVQSGGLLADLLGGDQDARHGWFWQLRQLPDAPQSRYLYDLLADNDFQEGLENYRDLIFMQHSLARWDGSMEAFAAMIDARTRAYALRVPQADALLATDTPSHLRAQQADAESRLQAIETGDDVVALATPKEREQWDRVARLQAQLAKLPPSLTRDNAADKARLIKGVLYWRLDAAFKARSYQEQRSLRQVDRALDELQNRWVRVQRARASVPTNNGQFAARVAAVGARITALHAELASAQRQQGQYLDQLAEAALRKQQGRLAAYQAQARFALANVYDRAVDADQTRAAPAAGKR